MEYRPIAPEHDVAVAELIRSNLKAHRLDIPGTVYFDAGLDHLSEFYAEPNRAYYVLLEDEAVIGGVGYAAFEGFADCCELQKLYLCDAAKGKGLGYELLGFIEDRARDAGFLRMYLETHTNLQAAIHLYEKTGYRQIPRPECVVHGTMNRFYLKEL